MRLRFSDVTVVKKDEKVSSSAATLLAKMGFTPFFYGLETLMVYDKGNMFDVKVLDIDDAKLGEMFSAGVKNIAALSFGANYATIAMVPHAIINGYKNLLSIACASDYTFEQAEKFKALL